MSDVYRIFGEGNELLYVGITDNYDLRMRQHSEKSWWRNVRRIEVESFPNRQRAAEVEAAAIKRERPKYNRAGNTTPPPLERIPRAQTKKRPGRSMLSIQQAAESASVSTKTIRRRIADGSLTGYRFGNRIIRVDARELDALFAPIPTTGGAS